MKTENSKNIIIVGGGPAGMMAAIELSKTHKVSLFEKGKTLGRKFLVAGKGGFNLSNSLIVKELSSKYTPNYLFTNILKSFDSKATVTWLEELGIPTYVGSSGRIFPEKGIKPIEVLNALKQRMIKQNVSIYLEHEMIDFNKSSITFNNKTSKFSKEFDTCIFALGGASWSITGSDGLWTHLMQKNNIKTSTFEPSNCGIIVNYNNKPIAQHIGTPLKNIRITFQDKIVKGEAVISTYGLEGNAIYPLANAIGTLLKKGQTTISIDLKPFNTEKELISKLTSTTQPKNYGYVYNLNKAQIALIKSFTDKETYINPIRFVKALKRLAIPIEGLRPIEEAISTTGGVPLEELNADLSLKKIPNIFIAGEMFDWDTITGGFLLQGCFATGYFVAKHIN